ncbi:MAG TPA: CaiB/BaiF CoA-transferase family protein [Candidatus Binataceae bacterium]|nr:CaiB/BaiF CoA-transferase family protein [Candidatus Binataceae bacterium]
MNQHGNLGSSLAGFTVLEIGDQLGDYATLLLAGLGAEIIKLEPRAGAASRRIGPFAAPSDDPERSLFFWRYNLNKKSVTLEVNHAGAGQVLAALASSADIVLLAGEFETVSRGLPLWRKLAEDNPRLIVCAITPFGLDGPYRALKATDLTQMALGGIMAVCGYDPGEDGVYDTPPIAPAMWHSYHLGGEYAAVAIMAAINFRELVGEGQFIDVSVHEAVNTCTEVAIPTYIYSGQVVKRQTARHAATGVTHARLLKSADGIFMLANLSPFEREQRALAEFADQAGIGHVLRTPEFAELEKEDRPAAAIYRNDLLRQVVASLPADELFKRAQALGLAWAPIRRPEENLDDPHFAARGSFATIDHPELRRTLRYPGTVASDGHAPHFSYTRRAPRLGEHTDEILHRAGLSDVEIAALRKNHVI